MRQVPSLPRVTAVIISILALSSLSSFAQTRTVWNTATDIRVGARGTMVGVATEVLSNSFTLIPDRDRNGQTVRVTSDSIVTRYLGFGRTTGEVFSGANGFAQLRAGDRVEVRGIGDTRGTIAAQEILLLGRPISGSQDSITVGATRTGTVEGLVRSIRPEDNRVVIETDQREMLTILGTASTPVYHEGGTYRIRNIEVGDRIRVEVESSSSSGVRPRLINVVSDATPESTAGGRTVTSIYGQVTRVDTRTSSFRIEDERGRVVPVDARNANDRAGNRFRLTDLRVGDRLEVSGEYDSSNNFRADTIRFSSERDRDDPFGDQDQDNDRDDTFSSFSSEDIVGTVDETFADNTIIVREQDGDRIRIFVDADFMVRNKQGTYIRATQLKRADRLEVQTFRDLSGRFIAQVIRIR